MFGVHEHAIQIYSIQSVQNHVAYVCNQIVKYLNCSTMVDKIENDKLNGWSHYRTHKVCNKINSQYGERF